jgi:monoterpene epsilon-lactone hydrolase
MLTRGVCRAIPGFLATASAEVTMLIHAGGDEILRFDALRLEELAKAAGVDVQLEIFPRMWHVWQIYLTLPQAIQSLDEIASFLGSHLGQGR